MSNNSDYNKPRIDLFSRIPEVHQSDTMKSLMDNLFNRFLTKQETERVAGYVGDGNPNAIVKRQIHENTVHRQGYQLQPILFNKIGSVEWMSSWYDILNEAERLGIERERMQSWLNLQVFNWAPPIDIDKLIHYQDYYWYDVDSPNSQPQYITIRSRCTTAQAQVNFYQRLVDSYGSTISTTSAQTVSSTIPSFSVVSIDTTTDQIIVTGNIVGEVSEDQYVKLTGTLTNNGVYALTADPTYDSGLNQSTLSFGTGILPGADEVSLGTITPQRFDGFVISGDYANLLDNGFVFFYKDSTNTEIDSSFWIVESSTYNENTDITTVRINTVFTNSVVDGVISLDERLSAIIADRDCQCTGSVGWDLLQWDDNPSDPLWDGDFATFISSISNAGPPSSAGSPTPANGDLWWDQTADILYQYSTDTDWKALWNNFSLVIAETSGLALWDSSPECEESATVIKAANQWSKANRWLHKTDVPNFSIAKQAAVPIIEYDWDLELNEWTYTEHLWKYRTNNLLTWSSVDEKPEYIELVPIVYYNLDTASSAPTRTIQLDERYGDLTGYFTEGRNFMITGVSKIFEVERSEYSADTYGEQEKTRIVVTEDIVAATLGITLGSPANGVNPAVATITTVTSTEAPLRPVKTSKGDTWKGYNIHWLYNGVGNTVPIPHVPAQYFTTIDPTEIKVIHSSGNYESSFTYYVQESSVLVGGTTVIELSNTELNGTDRSLRQRALVGFDDIRVYVNDIRQYGTYNELSECDLGGSPCDGEYVAGIEFLTGYELSLADNVRIEVGEATPLEFGRYAVSVRMVEDDTAYALAGNQNVSLISLRKEEQVKSEVNQYPLFDIHNVNGTPAYVANEIFGYQIDSDADSNGAVGLRLATDIDTNDYMFHQHLIEEDNGTMFAYRDYANHEDIYWVNPETTEVLFWDGLTWSNKKRIGKYYIEAAIGEVEPGEPWSAIDGAFWYDTHEKQLKQLTLGSPATGWQDIEYLAAFDDQTLQTIWKGGLNDEVYTPEKRDWEKRSQTEYSDQQDLYITEMAQEYVNQGMTESEAISQAETDWYAKQSNHLSTTGAWIGEWEIPDPLYFNVSHENRVVVSYRQLVTHFNSIIQSQEKVPAFTGPTENMFHLITTNDVNYGVGGKIKEFNYGLDTFLSSLSTNVISPRALYDFAHDGYESLLNNIKELLRKNAVDLMTDINDDAIQNLATYIINAIIEKHEQNDYLNLVYGDSTTFTDNLTGADVGIRNWIATLPYIKVMYKSLPYLNIDSRRGINQVVHHDGHREEFSLAQVTIDGIVSLVINTYDARTDNDKLGKASSISPPNNTTEFHNATTAFKTSINSRTGVYWYHTAGNTKTLYRLILADIGDEQPSVSLPDGSLWLDLSVYQEVLRIKETDPNTGAVEWNVVSGLTVGDSPIRLHNGADPSDVTTATVSAWQKVDLNSIFVDTILEIEQRLYDNAPEPYELAYDLAQLEIDEPQLYADLSEQAFLAYTSQTGITTPYLNDQYTYSNAFTWNYKYSSFGQNHQIVEVDPTLGTFRIQGDYTSTFIVGINFYIKNSSGNDGFWKTHASTASTYDSFNNETVIYVDGSREITDTTTGIMYNGLLPSPYDPILSPYNINDGSESGGDWRDIYQKVYNTPYPHLEPWKLQGYTGKPDWWDEEYKNDDETKWGDRRWKYKHGFEIFTANAVGDWFEIDGNFIDVFTKGLPFVIDSAPTTHNGIWQVSSLATITSVSTGTAGNAAVTISGNFETILTDGVNINIVNGSNALTGVFTVKSASYSGGSTVVVLEEAITSSTGLTYISGAIFDSTTNYLRIYVTTNVAYDTAEGRIAMHYGMWESIRTGIIPAGREYPNGIVSVTGNPSTEVGIPVVPLPQYYYFSVNIGNFDITTGGTFGSDDVLPPYWDYISYFGSSFPPVFDQTIRSLFYLFTSEIVSPGTDFTFGDAGPNEWEWRASSQYLYDQLSIAFQIDPIRFTYKTFGYDFYNIGGLYIDKITGRVLSHTNTIFHGDLVDDTIIKLNGTNQWYVNFNRYSGYDLSLSDFRSQWTQWTTPMMYQFSSFVDTPSFDIAHRYVCVSEFDYRLASKRSLGVNDYWIDSFEVGFIYIPPKLIRYDNDLMWNLELRTRSPIGKQIDYFDVHNYQFYVDPTTNICTLYTWPVTGVSITNDTFSVTGDQTIIFKNGRTFVVSDSTINDGVYTTVSSAYDQVNNKTIISVEENVVGASVNGMITADYRSIPWTTGDKVVLSSSETFPVPLEGDNVNGIYEYFIIVLSDNTFKLARTYDQATSNTPITVTSTGRGNQYVGQLTSTFTTQKTNKGWRHYAVDTTNVLSFTPPFGIRGLQSVVNVIDGYASYAESQGWAVNSNTSLRDYSNPSRFVSWHLELERMLDFAEMLRSTKVNIKDRYEVTVNATTDVWTFVNSQATLITGDAVSVFPAGGVYPAPLSPGYRYFMIRDSLTDFRLAATKADANAGIPIDITSITGVTTLYITEASNLRKQLPKFEINPFREGIWFRPEYGIVSNMLQQDAVDVFNSQLLFDQYGRVIGKNHLYVLRQDKETAINMISGIPNDVELTSVYNDPYNYIHLAACHLLIDTYEHVLIFNNNTTEGQLLYDPFIGLNVTKFELLFNRQTEVTHRPNVGGQYLSTFFNQGAELKRNIEASVEDLRTTYDTYKVIEANSLVQEGRKSLGYQGEESYLNKLNLSSKSQFVYWRGQIQAKGSINSVKAFINSRRFVDANVDEFWAVKVADFGSAAEQEYLEMWLNTADARLNDIRLQFAAEEDICNPGYDTNPFDLSSCGYAFPNSGESVFIGEDGFTVVASSDKDRWFEQPDQLETVRNNGGSVYFELIPSSKLNVYVGAEPDHTLLKNGDGWVQEVGLLRSFRVWDSSIVIGSPVTYGAWRDGTSGSWNTSLSDSFPIIRHNTKSDFITITLKWYPDGHKWCSSGGSPVACDVVTSTGSPPDVIKELTIDSYVPFSNSIVVFSDGSKLVNGSDYVEVLNNDELLSTKLLFKEDVTGHAITVVYKSATLNESIHFTRLTTNIIRLNHTQPSIFDAPNADPEIKVWGWTINEAALNPAKIIDKQTETVIRAVQIWDPARGYHYHNGINVVDLDADSDPAIYTSSPETYAEQQPNPNATFNLVYNDPWNFTEAGTTWLDTSLFDYVPYYDTAVFDTTDKRSRLWGKMTDWSTLKVYTWVESPVHPDEWNAAAIVEEGDASISESVRKSGRVREVLYEKVDDLWVEIRHKRDTFDVYIEGQGVGTNTFNVTVRNHITPRDVTITEIVAADCTISVGGDWSRRLLTGSTFTVSGSTLSDGVYQAETVEYDGTNTIITVAGSPCGLSDGTTGIVTFYDPVNIYVNGTINVEQYLISASGVVVVDGLVETDRVDVVQIIPTDETYIQAEIDAGNMLRQIPYTSRVLVNSVTGLSTTQYYFWIEDKTTRGKYNLSPKSAQEGMITIPVPNVFFQGVKDVLDVTYGGISTQLPIRFTQAIIRGVRGIIDDDYRYVIRWTRDFTLRDALSISDSSLEHKNLHQQWTLIRRDQPYVIPYWLWTKVIEAIVGYKLSDTSVRVPSLERELYDTEKDTDTRFGLGVGQTFADSTLALSTILADLTDANNDFTPVDIDVFFQNHSFDTADNIISAMTTIYNTFPYTHVNRMFFNVLLDGLSTKAKYKDIFKTSMVALHGVKIFQVAGLFDD